jgi:dual specificity phosphatase 12
MQVSGASCLGASVAASLSLPPFLAQRLRRHRRPLATSQYIISHNTTSINNDQKEHSSTVRPSSNCAHYFLDPLSWMRPELEHGKLDGRFECPKCHTNVGKYAWQGMQCSCSEWVVPGISLSKSRIDEVKKKAFSDIRHPPGMAASPPITPSHSRQSL